MPDDIEMLRRRREPLIDRLENLKNSTTFALSEASRTTIEEAMEMLMQLGWPRDG